MSPAVRRLGPAVLLAAGALLASAPPAGATSCATDPGATPEAIAAGTHSPAYGGREFFDEYDLALVGTVTGKQVRGNNGRTTVTFDVAGVLGRDEAPAVLDVTLKDDGSLNGYLFELGQGYFVPLVDRTPDGLRNFSFLCDPIAPVADPRAEYARLSALASGRGVPAAAPTPGAEAAAEQDPADAGPRWPGVAAGLLAVAVAGAVTAAAWRRRQA